MQFRKKLLSAALCVLLFSSVSFADGLGSTVQAINQEFFELKPAKTQLVDETIEMLRLNNKYTLNKWYREIKQLDAQSEDVLDFGGAEEKHIRPVAHHIFALAGALKLGVYSEKITNVPPAEAKKTLMRLIHSVSYRHKVNNKLNRGAWGGQWQSALWAAQIAQGAWFVWDELSPEDRDMVAQMVEAETNRFNTVEPPYYRNERDEVVWKGDSKAEENSWNATLLTLAVAMMPHHPNHSIWEKQNIIYQLSAYCTPADRISPQLIDGLKMSEVLKGSNANADGSVVNHGIVHPDYMTAIMFNIGNVWVNQMAGLAPLESSTHNGELVYKALTENLYKGKTMYQSTQDNQASCELYYPYGVSWGAMRQANFWLLDIMADQFGWGKNLTIKPLDWAQARSTEMLRMMHRDTTGQYYQDKQEDSFDSREEWIGQHLMWAYIAFCFAE